MYFAELNVPKNHVYLFKSQPIFGIMFADEKDKQQNRFDGGGHGRGCGVRRLAA